MGSLTSLWVSFRLSHERCERGERTDAVELLELGKVELSALSSLIAASGLSVEPALALVLALLVLALLVLASVLALELSDC